MESNPHAQNGRLRLTMRLAFRDKAGRDHYPARPQDAGETTSSGGFLDSLDAMEDILRSLLDLTGTASNS